MRLISDMSKEPSFSSAFLSDSGVEKAAISISCVSITVSQITGGMAATASLTASLTITSAFRPVANAIFMMIDNNKKTLIENRWKKFAS